MKKHLIYVLLCLLILLPACENELPFHTEPQKPQLLMNAVLEADKKDNLVYLHIIDGKKAVLVGDGHVTVYVNDEKKEVAEARLMTWVSDGSDSTKYCTLKTIFQPGDRVRLEAVAEENRYQASAEVVIPQPLEEPLQVDTLLSQLKIGFYVEPCMRYHIRLKDRPGEKNYYQLLMEEDDQMYSNYTDIINQEDIVLTDGHLTTADDDEFGLLDMVIQNKNNVFTDSRFQDTSYTLNVYTNITRYYNSDKDKAVAVDITIHLRSITREYYRYLRAMNCLDSEDYNATFMEPVIIPCNVTGGLGFVGASSEQAMKLRILDWPPYQHPGRNSN